MLSRPAVPPKAEGTVDVLTQLTGRGCAVMTASTHIQYAFERGADPHMRGEAQPSVFTHAIIEGLRTGAADLNADGLIDAAELYAYVYDRVKASTPEQTPTRNDQVSGELYIARSNRGMWLHPDLPLEIRQNLRSPRPHFRAAAIVELTDLANSGNEHEQAIAADTLRQLGEAPEPPPVAESPAPVPIKPEPATPPQPAAAAGLRLPAHGKGFGFAALAQRILLAGAFGTFATVGFLLHDRPYGVLLGILSTIAAIVAIGAVGRIAVSPGVILLKQITSTTSVVFRPDGRFLVCGGDSEGTLWDTDAWLRIGVDQDFGGHALFSPAGDILVANRWMDLSIRDGETFEHFADIPEEGRSILAFHPHQAMLASARGRHIRIFRTDTWTLDRRLSGTRDIVKSMAFAPDGTILASGMQSGDVVLWDTETWKAVAALSGSGGEIRSIAFSPDGTRLACWSQVGRISFWKLGDLSSPAVDHLLNGGSAIAFSPDGSVFAYGAAFSGIKLWDTASRSLIRTLLGHQRPVTSLAFSPDGSLLASTSLDGTVRLWPIRA